jgi:hypothetical protein
MREILFRGKDIISGEWITGFLVDAQHIGDWIESHPIRSDTVGQHTGLTDKNGKKIFEGDIVRNGDYTMIVVWYDFHAAFMLAFRVDGDYFEAISNSHIYLEVIGNIHDNPELLGGVGNGN